jgi:hypothetical protein
MNELNTYNNIFVECINDLSREYIIKCAKHNNEKPFGFVIDYIKDKYSLPKLSAWDIAKKVVEHFNVVDDVF